MRLWHFYLICVPVYFVYYAYVCFIQKPRFGNPRDPTFWFAVAVLAWLWPVVLPFGAMRAAYRLFTKEKS